MKLLSTTFCAILIVLAACKGEPQAYEAEASPVITEAPASSATEPEQKFMHESAPAVTSSGVELPQGKVQPPDTAPEKNVLTDNLTDGFWRVMMVLQGSAAREPYTSQKGRYFRFNPNGVYQLFNPDGTVFHEGTWAFQRVGDKANYLTLTATDKQYNNHYRIQMQDFNATLIGQQDFNNSDVQQRLEKLSSAP